MKRVYTDGSVAQIRQVGEKKISYGSSTFMTVVIQRMNTWKPEATRATQSFQHLVLLLSFQIRIMIMLTELNCHHVKYLAILIHLHYHLNDGCVNTELFIFGLFPML